MSATHMICLLLGIRIESEANGREHWRPKAARAKLQRFQAHNVISKASRHVTVGTPATITLTRIAPRKLDSDNLAGGFKAARDGIADWLEIDDGDDRLTWVYGQRKGAPGQYDAEVTITWKAAE